MRTVAALLLLGLAAFPNPSAAQVAPPSLLRTWNGTGSGLVKVTIARAGIGYTIHAWGQCSPTPCNWGTVPLTVYAPNVTSKIADAGTAVYTNSFDVINVVVKLQGATLTVQTFTRFTDHSGRSNYNSVVVLH
jgi:hypothetical protein